MLDAAREAGVDVVGASGACLAPFLALGEVPFVDGDDDELGERLRGMSELIVKRRMMRETYSNFDEEHVGGV